MTRQKNLRKRHFLQVPAGRELSIPLVLSSLLLCSGAVAQQIAITGSTIIDGTGKAPLSNAVVLISEGRIAAVGRSQDIAIPNGVRKINARGKYVIPGLMDAHTHLSGCGGLESMIKYEGRYHECILEQAQITLKTGQTTVFDTWGPRAALVKARDMINAGEAPGSRIYLAGSVIGWGGPFSADFNPDPARHLSEAFVGRINETWEQGTGRKLLWMTPEEVRSIVREYAQKDVNFLKYAGTDHKPGKFIAFSPRVQRVIVEEGHRAGLTVQAHTMSVESLDLVIEAGVDIVAHGDISGLTPIPEETLRKLVERGVAVAVLPVTQQYLEDLEAGKIPTWPAPVGEQPNLWTLVEKVEKTNQRNMIKAGVTMLLATDGPWRWPVTEAHFNALAALEEDGMDPMEILKSATSNIARAYKLDAKLGTLEPGKFADLLILDANPLESARNYRRIHTVIKDGKVVDRTVPPLLAPASPASQGDHR